MIVYFFLFFFFLLFALFYMHCSDMSGGSAIYVKRYGSIFLFLPFCLLIFLLGFRYEVGSDYWNYIEIFDRFEAGDPVIRDRFEVGFLAVLEGVSSLGLSGNFVLFLFYLFTITFFWIAIRGVGFDSASMVSLSVILFLGLGPVFSATNTVRQNFAISIVVLFCALFSRSKILSTIPSSAVGFLFHYSAPVALAFNFVPRKVLGFRFWGLASIFCVVLSALLIGPVFELLERNHVILGGFGVYFEGDGAVRESSGLGVRLIFEVFVFLFLSLFVKRINPKAVWFFNIAFVGALINYTFRDYAMFLRVSEYFSVFKVLAIPWFIEVFRGVERQLFFLTFAIYSFFAFARSATSEQFLPYKLVFFN
ncbi:EpsG family protein [Marinobacter sp. chi1]|uniref:EpsG family protein n=1 Tax=Marinobacter suaedae TaxID=3057675 RepID=A0ABT8VWE3_9GAMM|nr:EpsG family protein [Marinobacter sp. chi1]MDO3720304.1 EpsG family protein [Marinobacter sp. chi1]